MRLKYFALSLALLSVSCHAQTKVNLKNQVQGLLPMANGGCNDITGCLPSSGGAVHGNVTSSGTFTASNFHGLADHSVDSQQWAILPAGCPAGFSTGTFDIKGNALNCTANSGQSSGSAPGSIAQFPAGSQMITQPTGSTFSVGSSGSMFTVDASGNAQVQAFKAQVSAQLLPRIDVTMFGAVLGNDITKGPANLTAVQNAINYSQSHPIAPCTFPAIYIPGRIEITGELRQAQNITWIGDQANGILQETPGSTNLLTVAGSVTNGCTQNSAGTMTPGSLNFVNLTFQGYGTQTTGSLLEIDQNNTVKFINDEFFDTAGYGFTANNVERVSFYGGQFELVRKPILASGDSNEWRIYGTQMNNTGETIAPGGVSFSYSVNASPTTGQFPAANVGTPVSLPWTASTNFGLGTIINDGTTNCSGTSCNWQASATTNTAASNTNPLMGVTGTSVPSWTAADGTTVSDGTLTWTNITHRSLIRPDYHCSVTLSGEQHLISGTSIKSQKSLCAYELPGRGDVVQDNYGEGFPADGVPILNAFYEPGGTSLDHFVSPNPLAPTDMSVPLSNPMWFPAYSGTHTDFTQSSFGGGYRIYPVDYNANSTAASVVGQGVLQNQFEVVILSAVDHTGTLWIAARHQSGSTVNTSVTWPQGQFFVALPGSNLESVGGTTFINNHIETDQSLHLAGFAEDCSLTTPSRRCGTIIGNVVPDGQVVLDPGLPNAPASSSFGQTFTMIDQYMAFGGDAWAGQGAIVCDFMCDVNSIGVQPSSNATTPVNSGAFHLWNFGLNGIIIRSVQHQNGTQGQMSFDTAEGLHITNATSPGFAGDMKVVEFNGSGGNGTSVSTFSPNQCSTDADSDFRTCVHGKPQTGTPNFSIESSTNAGASWNKLFVWNFDGTTGGANQATTSFITSSSTLTSSNQTIFVSASTSNIVLSIPDCTSTLNGIYKDIQRTDAITGQSVQISDATTLFGVNGFIVGQETPMETQIPVNSHERMTCTAVGGGFFGWMVDAPHGSADIFASPFSGASGVTGTVNQGSSTRRGSIAITAAAAITAGSTIGSFTYDKTVDNQNLFTCNANLSNSPLQQVACSVSGLYTLTFKAVTAIPAASYSLTYSDQ